MQLIYFMSESLAPEKFARILNPADARYELERHYLFGGSSMSSISSRHTITRNTQSGIGVSSYREDSGMKRGVFDELKTRQFAGRRCKVSVPEPRQISVFHQCARAPAALSRQCIAAAVPSRTYNSTL